VDPSGRDILGDIDLDEGHSPMKRPFGAESRMTMVDLGTPYLRCERRGALIWCTIDRPKSRNALTPAMYYGIRRAVELTNLADEPTALVLTGEGDVFAPGGEMRGRHEDETIPLGELMGNDILPFETLRRSRAPVVSAVNGICQGGGLLIAMLSDLAIASERASFRAPELLRGVADTNYAAYLPAHVGIARARDLLFTARTVDAREAVEMGLVARMVPHESLRHAAREAAESILLTAPEARVQLKRIINAGYGAVDRMTFDASIQAEECREGFRAFSEKRAPAWVPEALRNRRS
jgi:enoyl-CoA hydratase